MQLADLTIYCAHERFRNSADSAYADIFDRTAVNWWLQHLLKFKLRNLILQIPFVYSETIQVDFIGCLIMISLKLTITTRW